MLTVAPPQSADCVVMASVAYESIDRDFARASALSSSPAAATEEPRIARARRPSHQIQGCGERRAMVLRRPSR